MVNIAVIGGGIVGVSSAYLIQKHIPHAKITIIADKFTPETTSDNVAGLWTPYIVGSDENLAYKWVKATYDFCCNLWKSEDSSLHGISLISTINATTKVEPIPFWKDIPLHFRVFTSDELVELNARGVHPDPFVQGYEYISFTCEPKRLIPQMMKSLMKNGAKTIRRKVLSLDEIVGEYDVIINSTGLGALELMKDKEMAPIRGQTYRCIAPWNKRCYLLRGDLDNYIIPNFDINLIGGTKQKGNWNTEPNKADEDHIIKGCEKIVSTT